MRPGIARPYLKRREDKRSGQPTFMYARIANRYMRGKEGSIRRDMCAENAGAN